MMLHPNASEQQDDEENLISCSVEKRYFFGFRSIDFAQM